MDRTPDEIKKAMAYCVEPYCPGEKCPYWNAESCAQDKTYDALALIQQLEAERDAAVEAVKRLKRCVDCKHATIVPDMTSIWVDCPKRDGRCSAKSLWEWRGVKKEDEHP